MRSAPKVRRPRHPHLHSFAPPRKKEKGYGVEYGSGAGTRYGVTGMSFCKRPEVAALALPVCLFVCRSARANGAECCPGTSKPHYENVLS